MAKIYDPRGVNRQPYAQRLKAKKRKTLAQTYQDALNKANQKNEERYGDILQGYDDLHGRVMGGLAGMGNAQRADIDRSYRNLGSGAYQSLVNRGFANSSALGTIQQGIERERQQSHNRLNESLSRQRAGYDMGITQGRLGVMERRNDVGPDINQMLALAQNLGRGGYGAGGGGGGFSLGGMNLGNLYSRAMYNHFNPLAAFGMQPMGFQRGGNQQGFLQRQGIKNDWVRMLRRKRNAS